MLTKEEFQREFIRMMDSVRYDDIGSFGCEGVSCRECPLHGVCRVDTETVAAKAPEIIEAVEKWSKEHPITTMEDKYKEMFGVEPRNEDGYFVCPHYVGFHDLICAGRCTECEQNFWESEYKEPSTKESEV